MALPIRLKSAPPKSRPAPIMLDQSAALERHYTPSEIAKAWGISTDTVRELFRSEPGVIDLSAGRNSSRRRYSTIRIPRFVVERVYARRQRG